MVADPGSGGATFATDDIAGVHYPITKVAWGPLDTVNIVDDATGKRLPVEVAEPIPAGTNNIGDVDVLSLPALPAGTNNIGDVDVLTLPALPAGTNNIGDIDVLSVVPGTAATNLGKAVDSASGATDTGVAVLAVRDDALSALTPIEGDYVPLRVNSTGALHVTGGGGGTEFAEDTAHSSGANGSLPLAVRRDADTSLVDTDGDYAPLQVNASGSLKVAITAGAGSGGTAMADDAAFTPASTSVTPMGAMADETTPDSVDEGDCGVVRMSLNRNLYTQIRDVSAERSCTVTAANALKVDGSAVTQPVSGTVTANLAAGTNNIGDVDVLTLPGVAGDVAHDGADSGNPLKIGARAIAHGTNPTAVAADDRTNIYANRHGIPFAITGHMNPVTLTNEYTAAQTDTALVTVGAGTKIVVTGFMFSTDKATSVNVEAKLGFGAASIPASGAGVLAWHGGVDPGGGFARGNGGGILGVGADGEDLRFTCGVPTGGSANITVNYYTIES